MKGFPFSSLKTEHFENSNFIEEALNNALEEYIDNYEKKNGEIKL